MEAAFPQTEEGDGLGMIQAHCIALHSFLQGIVPPRDRIPWPLHCRWILATIQALGRPLRILLVLLLRQLHIQIVRFGSWRSEPPAVCWSPQ